MNIWGIYSRDGMPICELLVRGYDNSIHENHIEIARRHHRETGRKYACILLCWNDGGTAAYTF